MLSSNPIFISYRRSDSQAEAGRIYDRLVTEFGQNSVFKDVNNIPFGADFAEHIDRAIGQCQIVLVIIGKTWATTTADDNGIPRLENPNDLVRLEVESALKRDIPTIPVLLEDVEMPQQEQLPEPLRLLARRNAVEVGYDPRFHDDMTRLVNGMKALIKSVEANVKDSQPSASNPSIEHPNTAEHRQHVYTSQNSYFTETVENQPSKSQRYFSRWTIHPKYYLAISILLSLLLLPFGLIAIPSSIRLSMLLSQLHKTGDHNAVSKIAKTVRILWAVSVVFYIIFLTIAVAWPL